MAWGWENEWNEWGGLRGTTYSYRINYGDEMYSLGNIVSVIIDLFGDRW